VQDAPEGYPEPMGLTDDEIFAVLAKISPDVSYPEWIKVGQALQHERPEAGITFWIEWSSHGSKFPGEDLLREKWAGFGHAAKPVTMRSIIRDYASTADADEFDVIEDPREIEMAALGLIPFRAFADRDTPRWIVRDVLPQAGLGVVYGAPGSGKSFLVFDLAAHIARGLAWNGKRTRRGKVVYAAGEGVGGLTMRTRAYIQANEVEGDELDDGFKFYPAPVKLLTDDWKPFAKLVEQAGGADVIIVDTLAQSMAGGDENASEDMGRAIGHCRALHEATGALVLLVHHSGKDTTRGARGWSGLRGAADVEIEVVRDDETGQRYARTAKQKDGQDNETFYFRLAPVDLGRDEHGDGLSSCVVEYVDETTGRRKPKGGPHVTLVWGIVQEYVDLSEGTIRIDDIVVLACERSAEQDTTKVAAATKRALEQLRQQGFITIHNGEVRLA
jgi:hypothetical protein